MSDEKEDQNNEVAEGGGAAEAGSPATATASDGNAKDEQAIEGKAGGPQEAEFDEVQSSVSAGAVPIDPSLDRVYDLTVPVTVEVGHTNLSVQDILQLAPGSVVELDHAADAPVELLVHGKCVAKGEIVVVDDFYGVRITGIGET